MSNTTDDAQRDREPVTLNPRRRLLALAERIGATVHRFGSDDPERAGLIVILDQEPERGTAPNVHTSAALASALSVPDMSAEDFDRWYTDSGFVSQAAAARHINALAERSGGEATNYSTSVVGQWRRGERPVPFTARYLIHQQAIK